MSKTLALYMRLSSEDDNAGESDSIRNQRELLRSFVSGRREFKDWEIIEFQDDGCSGTSFNRPEVKRLLMLARQKRIQCIIVKDFSRFGRNYIDVCDYLEQVFPLYGVRFIAVNDNYDSEQTKGSSVGMDVALKSMISELYSRDISAKIRSSNKVRWSKGEYLGTIAFYGYKLSETKKNKLVIDEPAAVIVRRVFQLALDGINPNDIAVLLNQENLPAPLAYRKQNGMHFTRGWKVADERILWTRFSVKRILCDERYTGKLVSHKRTKADVSAKKTKANPKSEWIVADNSHEPLVTEEQFEKAGLWFKKKNMKGKPVSSKGYPLTSILKCGYCNHTLARVCVKEPYYNCYMSHYEKEAMCKGIKISEKVLSHILLEVMNKQIDLVLRDGRNPSEFTFTGHQQIQSLQKQILCQQEESEKLKIVRKNAFEEYCFQHISKQQYAAILETNTQQMASLSEHIHAMQAECSLITETAQETEHRQIHKKYKFADELNKDMAAAFIKEIRVFQNNRFEVVWSYEDYYKMNANRDEPALSLQAK